MIQATANSSNSTRMRGIPIMVTASSMARGTARITASTPQRIAEPVFCSTPRIILLVFLGNRVCTRAVKAKTTTIPKTRDATRPVHPVKGV
ncbi:MAG: hypothetical protein Q7I94_03920 [Candidatus Contubernalis sp.]|nr:hypothetical protein [Candidatus Contubernalis sp.]